MNRLARLPRPARIGFTLVLAWLSALACERLRVPLPWMIGPLLITASCGVLGAPLATSAALRNFGQWAIGCALGLYFTPQVLQLLLPLAPALLAGVLWALLLGHAFYAFLWRIIRDQPGAARPTAYFAAAIGGASEMAVLAEQHGGQIDRVAAAHSLRVLLVVVLIPFGFQAAGLHGLDHSPAGVQQVHGAGLAFQSVLSLLGVLLMRRLDLPNPWVLGALSVTLLLSASGVELSAMPKAMTDLGQLFIGVALGTRFTPEFAHSAPRWLAAVAIGTLAMITLSAGFAWLLAGFVNLHPATVLLGTSPGGIAEMCITAKVLQLGVPVVTTFHVVRYIAVLLFTAPLYRREARRHAAASHQ